MNKKNKFNGLQSQQRQQQLQVQQQQQLSKMRVDNFGSNATGIYDGYPNNNVLSTNSTSLSSLTPLQSQALVQFGGNNNAIANYNGSGNGNCYSNTSSTNLQLLPTNNADTKMYQSPTLYTQQNQNSSNISGSGMYSYGDPAGTSYNNNTNNRNQSLLNSKNQSVSRKNGLDSTPSAFMSMVPFSQQKQQQQQQQQDQQQRCMIDMKPNSTNNNGRSEWLKNQSTSPSSNNNWISNYSQQNNVPINTQLPSQYQYFPQMIGDSIYNNNNNNNNYQLPTFTNNNMLNSSGTIPNLISSYGGSGNGMNSVNFPTMQNTTGYNMMPTAQTNNNGYIFGQNNSQQYLPSSLQHQQQNIPIVMGGMQTTNGNTTGMMGFNNNNNYSQFSGYGGYGTKGGAMYPSSSFPVMNGSYNGYEMMKGYQNNNNPMMRSNNGLMKSRSFYDMSSNFCGGNGLGGSFGGGGGGGFGSGVSPNYRTMNNSGMEVLCGNGNGISMNLPLVPQGYVPEFINDLQYYGNLNDCQVYPGRF